MCRVAVDSLLNVLVQKNCMVRLVQKLRWGESCGEWGWCVGRRVA